MDTALFILALMFLIGLIGTWGLYEIRRKTVADLLAKGGLNDLSKFEIVDGSKIHYVKTGRGPALVLLHGIGASTYTWRRLIPHLVNSFQVIAVDIPGFGLSDKDPTKNYDLDTQTSKLHQLLEKLNIKEATLVGSSMGGNIALWMARRWPDQYKNIVAIAPPLHPRVVPFDFSRFALFSRPLRLFVNRHLITTLVKRTTSDHTLIDPETIAAYSLPYADKGESLQAFLKALKAIRDPRLPKDLQKIKASVLILWGDQDRVIKMASIKEAIDFIPNKKIVTHPLAGHHPMEDYPDWVKDKIMHFLKSND